MFPASLATRYDDQISIPLTILTAASMALDATTSERDLVDVSGTGGILSQSTHMALETRESGWT